MRTYAEIVSKACAKACHKNEQKAKDSVTAGVLSDNRSKWHK